MLRRKTPLAWCMLTHSKKRLLLSITGVAFAVFLMFIEMGFLNGVYDSQSLLIESMNADLIMVATLKDALNSVQPFPRQRLTAALKCEGVSDVYPVYMAPIGNWKEAGRRIHSVSVIGFDPETPAFEFEGADSLRRALTKPHTAIADRRSRRFITGLTTGSVAELNGRSLRIVGEFELGPDFVVDGRLMMSDRNFVRYFPDPVTGRRDLNPIEFGLIRVDPGVDAESVRRTLTAALPPDVRVVEKAALVAEEKRFWATNQPIGLIFGLGMVVGFIIGVTICYQILFTDINDHRREFATLKAIGYDTRYLIGVVIKEAWYLSLIAFVPGFLISMTLYSSLQEMTGITMRFTWSRVAAVFGMTVIMCLLSGTLALRKVIRSDPAEVF